MLILELDADRIIRRHVSQNKKDKSLMPELCFVVIEHNQLFILSMNVFWMSLFAVGAC